MENLDFSKIFNMTKEDLVTSKESKQDFYFNPSPEDNKPYVAQIRLIPYVFDGSTPIVESTKYFCKDSATGSKFNGYCPSTIGKPSILKDAWIACKNSKSVMDNDLCDSLKNGKRFLSAIYVIEDKNTPENNGKILFWDFGKTIYDKIVGLLEPDFGEACNVFDLSTGKNMIVKVEKKGVNNNYDSCNFAPTSTPFEFEGKTFDGTAEMQQALGEFLMGNTPKTRDEYTYRAWTDGTWDAALKYLDVLLPNSSMKAKLWKSHGYNYNAWSTGDDTPTSEMAGAEKIMSETTSNDNSSTVTGATEDDLVNSL